MQIFNWLGWLIGYPLYGVYFVMHSYGIAVIVLTILLNLIMFPSMIKQQRNMAGSMKMQKKVQELQKIYGNDRVKLAEEQQKLYEKEGMGGMGSGCLMMVLPMVVFMAFFAALSMPLTNVLHLDSNALSQASTMMQKVPGDVLASSMSGAYASQYRELDIAKNFNLIQPFIGNLFSSYDMSKLSMFSNSFTFLGLDLLVTPAIPGHFWTSLFSTPLWLLPFSSIALQLWSTIYMQISQKKMGQAQPGAQQGCMIVFLIAMQVWFGYITCTVPAAMSLYYTVNGAMGVVRTWLMQKYYSPQILTAQAEGSHVLLMEQKEAVMKPLPQEVQDELERQVRNWNQMLPNGEAARKKKSGKAQNSSKGKNNSPSKTDYMGQKK
ncbi:MAG: YidC/Oxa1 family membrane protein insertase [Oscillospiraceae bacterium]|jgi:YidC/Oxa1 family membrane protein insertase|nr:YidC/Oxa1 family membrane protein insertase [Oscillospiraceae bacterium]